ncbi:response regulator [Lyngbya aestuarii]|uniref:response regulator n=1 Tax=Lyngbya aestuarii TaxID=118322 RepID=UPI00403DFB58
MAMNPDIRDQAYQFFCEEAPELLQIIEGCLLTLRYDRSVGRIHELMRAAHSIKGGAASVELDAISTLAHHLETIFKALYPESLEIDSELEAQLLQAYDCLRLPLIQQLTEGGFDQEQALTSAEPIFAQIEEQLADYIKQAENYIPSSSELGIDMAWQIFEVDVADGLERLALIVANPQDYQVTGELIAQAEVFAGFAELLNKSGFAAIAATTLAAINTHPDQVLQIAQLALTDFQAGREAVLAGDSEGGSPSAALIALASASSTATETPELSNISIAELEELASLSTEESETTIPLFEDVFGEALQIPEFASLDMEENAATSVEEIQLIDGEFSPVDLEWEFANEKLEIAASDDDDQVNNLTLEELNHQFTIDNQLVNNTHYLTEEQTEENPSLESVFGSDFSPAETEVFSSSSLVPIISNSSELQAQRADEIESTDTPENLELAIQSIVDIFESLPPIQEVGTATFDLSPSTEQLKQVSTQTHQNKASVSPNLSVRVNSNRLERMNNLVGELAINRSGLSLQNEQLQGAVRGLINRFSQLRKMVGNLQELSDRMLVSDQSYSYSTVPSSGEQLAEMGVKLQELSSLSQANFDSLEMDNYGTLHSLLQGFLEEMVQLEESVGDIGLFASQSDEIIEQQRQMLTDLRNELMWARMLPLGEVLNRFPRVLHDLSTSHHKSVDLKLIGKGVLVDRAILDKIYDPLLHLLRNAFDHGIESPQIRRQQGKPEQGQIEIKAYHQGSQTILEVKDDGQGIDPENIRSRARELEWLSEEQLAKADDSRLLDLIFEPGFSTAKQVSQLSGRGIGLDVVRSQLQLLKGSVTITSKLGVGTTFILRLPLTLTITKLLVCLVGSTAVALPSDSIEEIVIPKADQIKKTGSHRFLTWRGEIVPTYRLADLLDYTYPMAESSPGKALVAVPSPTHWVPPLLVLRRGQQTFALEIERLVTEQELVIKPFGALLTAPSYSYGCTILGDGSLIPVINGSILLDQFLDQEAGGHSLSTGHTLEKGIRIGADSQSAKNNNFLVEESKSSATTKLLEGSDSAQVNRVTHRTPSTSTKILIVDDAVALRRTLALSLEKHGYRVLQARDGWEALKQLQHSSDVKLVICDIEMPNMNGFDFLSHRRQDPQLQKIPVVMLTSRSNNKHQWLATHLGATAYFTKPYIEQGFLKAIKDIIINHQ